MSLFKRKKIKEEIKEGYESGSMTADKPMDYLLNVCLKALPAASVVEDGYIRYTDWEIVVTPDIEDLHEKGAIVNFYVSSPDWGKVLFECCASMGNNPKQALENACSQFLASFMQGIAQMNSGNVHERISTDFGGRQHRFEVYLSDIIGMGNSPKPESASFYWDLLKNGIIKRLGNQKMCYVKVYGCRTFGDSPIIGECRIDDVKSDELSEIVAKIVEKWDVEPFASHKAFFFIKQEEATIQPYPYLYNSGYQLFKEKVKTAAALFHESDTQEKYDMLLQRLKEALDDDILADECFSFLPEICAENAFNNITYPETVQIYVKGKVETCYKAALADYNRLASVIFELFNEGVFGEATNDIYREYISMSAIYSVICQAKEKDEHAMESGAMSALLFQMPDEFEIR